MRLLSIIVFTVVLISNTFGQTTPTTQVKTIADLVALRIPTINNRLTALVTGRVTENDGGGGTFFYDGASAVTTNLGTVFKPAASEGRWIREFADGLNQPGLNVKWFGAVGDGVTDDHDAIQAAINMSNFRTIFFPHPEDGQFYAIGDTLRLGEFVVNASSNVTGVVNQKIDFTMIGEIASTGAADDPRIEWIGAAQLGTTSITVTNGSGTFPLITDAKPLIHVVGGRNHTFKHLILDGNDLAYSALHYEFHHFGAEHDFVVTRNVRIGIRNGQNWDYEGGVSYLGYMADPSWATGVTAVGVGGWQGDTFLMQNCSLTFNGIAGFSTESSQNFNQVFFNGNFGGAGGKAGVAITGGYVSILNSNFTSTSTTVADVWSNAGSNLGIFKDIHSESGATNFLTTANSAVSQWWSLESVRAQDILVTAGGGTFDISNSNLGDIHRVDGNVPFSLSMRNTSMTNLVLNSTIKTNIYLNLDNIQYKGTGNFLAGSDPTDWQGVINNVNPESAFGNKTYVLNTPTSESLTITNTTGQIYIKQPTSVLFPDAINVNGGVYLAAGNVTLRLDDQSQAADNRIWDVGNYGGVLTIRTLNNAGSVADNAITIPRSGTTVSAVNIATSDLAILTVGKGLKIKEGSNARMGVATLSGGTITVANTSVTTNTRVFVSRSTTGGTEGTLSTTQINATSFTINSTSGTDTSTVNWLLIEPSP